LFQNLRFSLLPSVLVSLEISSIEVFHLYAELAIGGVVAIYFENVGVVTGFEDFDFFLVEFTGSFDLLAELNIGMLTFFRAKVRPIDRLMYTFAKLPFPIMFWDSSIF